MSLPSSRSNHGSKRLKSRCQEGWFDDTGGFVVGKYDVETLRSFIPNRFFRVYKRYIKKRVKGKGRSSRQKSTSEKRRRGESSKALASLSYLGPRPDGVSLGVRVDDRDTGPHSMNVGVGVKGVDFLPLLLSWLMYSSTDILWSYRRLWIIHDIFTT